MAPNRIDHSEIGAAFLRHLEQTDNRRILFSGPFGTGKSTFLREVLSDRRTYLVLSINPINYSIGSNQDVFEWVKYDILLDLINKHAPELQLTREDFSTLLTSQMYLMEKGGTALTLISPLIALSEKIGKPITTVLTALHETVKDFGTFRKQLEQDEGELIMQYIRRLEATPGSPYEKDPLSKLIGTLLERLKVACKKDGKQITTVLVIDDLDRLDPEHMFRLFNVFSAHYDINDTNKFGFEKVIFVCDVENIRKIFHHRYGTEVDFNGYIDKFYSTEIFDFNNRALIKSFVRDLVHKLPLSNAEYERTSMYVRNSPFYDVLRWLLYGFIQASEVNLRMLVQVEQISIATGTFPSRVVRQEFSRATYPLLTIFSFFRSLFPSVEILEVKLRRVASLFSSGFLASAEHFRHTEVGNIDRAVATYCIPFLLDEERGFDQYYMETNRSTVQHCILPNDVIADFKYETGGSDLQIVVTKLAMNQNRDKKVPINNFQLVYETFKVCREKGIL